MRRSRRRTGQRAWEGEEFSWAETAAAWPSPAVTEGTCQWQPLHRGTCQVQPFLGGDGRGLAVTFAGAAFVLLFSLLHLALLRNFWQRLGVFLLLEPQILATPRNNG